MAYTVPAFNLLCNIGQPVTPRTNQVPAVWRLLNVPCVLAYGRRVAVAPLGVLNSQAFSGGGSTLLLPKLTDVRGQQDNTSWDMVECPPGTNRFYSVCHVDDVGKGFANEHRVAVCVPVFGLWVAPYL